MRTVDIAELTAEEREAVELFKNWANAIADGVREPQLDIYLLENMGGPEVVEVEYLFHYEPALYDQVWQHPSTDVDCHPLSYVFCHAYRRRPDLTSNPHPLVFVIGRMGNTNRWGWRLK